jgi:predicted O-methyltransferase YrrM
MEKYIEVLEKFTQQRLAINRLWNIGEQTANLLKLLVLIKKPSIVLELGTSNGYSTFHLAELLPKKSKLYTVDVEPVRQDLAKDNLKDFKNIVFISKRIEDYIPLINYRIDFLFIDANKLNYLKYLKELENKMSDGAIIIADNINSHGGTIDEFLKYIYKFNKKFTTIKLDIESGVIISKFNIRR